MNVNAAARRAELGDDVSSNANVGKPATLVLPNLNGSTVYLIAFDTDPLDRAVGVAKKVLDVDAASAIDDVVFEHAVGNGFAPGNASRQRALAAGAAAYVIGFGSEMDNARFVRSGFELNPVYARLAINPIESNIDLVAAVKIQGDLA